MSATSSTGGGKTSSSRPNRPRTCSRARFVVAVEATIFGPTGVAVRPSRCKLVDRRLEQPDRGAQRAGDQVQLVLDDQVRRPEPDHRPAGRPPASPAFALCLARQPVFASRSSMPVAVPLAPLADLAEQRAGVASPGQPGELVDGGDHERGREPVDLLVDGQDRQALPAAAPRERAAILALSVRAVDEHAPRRRRRSAGPGDRRSACRTTGSAASAARSPAGPCRPPGRR